MLITARGVFISWDTFEMKSFRSVSTPDNSPVIVLIDVIISEKAGATAVVFNLTLKSPAVILSKAEFICFIGRSMVILRRTMSKAVKSAVIIKMFIKFGFYRKSVKKHKE